MSVKYEHTVKVSWDTYTDKAKEINIFFEGMGVEIMLDNQRDVPMDFWHVFLTDEQHSRFKKWLEG